MKKIIALSSVLLLSIFLTACGGNNDQLENNPAQGDSENIEDGSANDNEQAGTNDSGDDELGESNVSDEAENQDDMKEMMEALDFDEIEVEVSYGKDQEYEIQIEHHRNGDIEAEVEDEINNVDIDDDLKAFNHIYPYAKQLDVDRSMEKQAVIDEVLKAFELEDHYEKFEVEITFNDGTKLSFEDRK